MHDARNWFYFNLPDQLTHRLVREVQIPGYSKQLNKLVSNAVATAARKQLGDQGRDAQVFDIA
jgi:hypothetical protein